MTQPNWFEMCRQCCGKLSSAFLTDIEMLVIELFAGMVATASLCSTLTQAALGNTSELQKYIYPIIQIFMILLISLIFRCVASNSEGSDSGVINLTGKKKMFICLYSFQIIFLRRKALTNLKTSLKSYKLLIRLYTSQILLPAFIFYPGSQSEY